MMSISLKDRLGRSLALFFRRWGRSRNRDDPAWVLHAARATMRRKKYCLLATVGDGGIDARVLQPFPPDPDLGIWLGTGASSRKVAQLRADSRATLVYEDDAKSACVTLRGRIAIVDSLDERRKRFRSSWWAFWPDGPEGNDYLLLRFQPSRIEVWDATRRVTPEPFGLRSAQLELRDGTWEPATAVAANGVR